MTEARITIRKAKGTVPWAARHHRSWRGSGAGERPGVGAACVSGPPTSLIKQDPHPHLC